MIIYSNCFNVLGMGSLANISMVAKKKKKNTGLKTKTSEANRPTLQRRSTTLNLLNLYFRQNHPPTALIPLWHVTFLWCGHNMRVSLLICNGTLVRILLAPAVNQFECESGREQQPSEGEDAGVHVYVVVMQIRQRAAYQTVWRGWELNVSGRWIQLTLSGRANYLRRMCPVGTWGVEHFWLVDPLLRGRMFIAQDM